MSCRREFNFVLVDHENVPFLASYMLVDPCTRNVFFVDSNTQSIKVMDSTGTNIKTLKHTNLTNDANTSIQMLTQDLVHK